MQTANCKSNQVQSYVLLLHILWADQGVWFSHKFRALKVEPFQALLTQNHLSVIPFRESTYTVNMNEYNVMLPPTFLNRHLCGGKRFFQFSKHRSRCLRISSASLF